MLAPNPNHRPRPKATGACFDCSAPTTGRNARCERCKKIAACESVTRHFKTPKGRASKNKHNRNYAARLRPLGLLNKGTTGRVRYLRQHFAHVRAWRAYRAAQRIVRVRRPALIAAAKVCRRTVLLSYPYIEGAPRDAADLLAVCNLIPANVPDRDDLCQDIMLAIIEGRAKVCELVANPALLASFRTRNRKVNYESSGYAVSLDMPRLDGRTWGDILPDDETRAWC